MVTTPDLPEHRKLLVSLPVAVVLLAPEQIISWVNPAAEQFFGQSNRRLMGKPLGDVLDVVEPRLARRLAEGDAPVSARQIDVQLIGQGPRRLDITAGPVADRPGWMVMTLHDTVAADAMRENGPGSSQARCARLKSWRMRSRTHWPASRARRNCWAARWRGMTAR
jgi:two-component system nitrogen regulation sensor histidine kinase GlnL